MLIMVSIVKNVSLADSDSFVLNLHQHIQEELRSPHVLAVFEAITVKSTQIEARHQ